MNIYESGRFAREGRRKFSEADFEEDTIEEAKRATSAILAKIENKAKKKHNKAKREHNNKLYEDVRELLKDEGKTPRTHRLRQKAYELLFHVSRL